MLDFDEAASHEYAGLRSMARAAGVAIGDIDALIAAIARAHRFIVASRDTTPFEAADVQVVDPWNTGPTQPHAG